MTVMVVLLTVWPHHHHGSQMCVAIECCEYDGAINDEHTSHRSTPDDESHHEGCQLQLLGESHLTKGVDFRFEKVDFKKMIFPLLSVLLDDPAISLYASPVYADTNEHLFNYLSTALVSHHGLRAPPMA